MEISIVIFDYAESRNRHIEPKKLKFKGDWALEMAIKQLIVMYYSDVIAAKVMSYLSERRK